MANSADPDQLASSEANSSGSTLFAKAVYIQVQQDKGNFMTCMIRSSGVQIFTVNVVCWVLSGMQDVSAKVGFSVKWWMLKWCIKNEHLMDGAWAADALMTNWPCNVHSRTYCLSHTSWYCSVALGKMIFSIQKVVILFLFLHENICCGYALEAPHWCASNEYPQHMFSWRKRKHIYLMPPHLSRPIVLFLLGFGWIHLDL